MTKEKEKEKDEEESRRKYIIRWEDHPFEFTKQLDRVLLSNSAFLGVISRNENRSQLNIRNLTQS